MSRWIICAISALMVMASTTLRAQEPPAAPQWFPLTAEQDKHLDEVLKYWEWQASQIQRYRCKFTRWEYDPVVLPRDKDIAASIAQGSIQFAAPDKGLFKVEKLHQIVVQKQGNVTIPSIKDGRPEYSAPKNPFFEHWICDGKSIFEFDAITQQLKMRRLPAEMQGKQITEGPLPFLFGAKAQTIKQRYWVRVVAPPPKPNHFWLECIPKNREQAADFKAVHIIIDNNEFLPTAMILHETAGGRATYEFSDREKNWLMLPDAIVPFRQQFYEPQLPAGWKRVEEAFGGAGPGPAEPITQAPMIGPPQPRQAAGAKGTPMRR